MCAAFALLVSFWAECVLFALAVLASAAVAIVVLALLWLTGLWLKSVFADAGIGFLDLLRMLFKGIPPSVIVRAKIKASRAGVHAGVVDLETLHAAGGSVLDVVRALAAAANAGLKLDFKSAAALSLAGRNPHDAVRRCLNPAVIDIPDAHASAKSLSAVAGDGIELKVRARMTVQGRIEKFASASEETLVARVSEALASVLGSEDSHREVVRNPRAIAGKVMSMGLDDGGGFEILSFHILEAVPGENVLARLAAEQAESEARAAKAKAEERLAMAGAKEQEMMAAAAENRAKILLAEAEVPKAIAQAFKEGNIGVTDYYNLRNVQADTAAKEASARAGDRPERRRRKAQS